jgi:hypothetical protein
MSGQGAPLLLYGKIIKENSPFPIPVTLDFPVFRYFSVLVPRRLFADHRLCHPTVRFMTQCAQYG